MNVEQSFFFRRRLRYRRNRFWKFVEYARTWTGCIKWSSNLATHRSIWFLFVRLMKEYLYYCFFKNKNNIISSNALVYIFNNWRFEKNKKFKIIYIIFHFPWYVRDNFQVHVYAKNMKIFILHYYWLPIFLKSQSQRYFINLHITRNSLNILPQTNSPKIFLFSLFQSISFNRKSPATAILEIESGSCSRYRQYLLHYHAQQHRWRGSSRKRSRRDRAGKEPRGGEVKGARGQAAKERRRELSAASPRQSLGIVYHPLATGGGTERPSAWVPVLQGRAWPVGSPAD